jgi:hypothetical protein
MGFGHFFIVCLRRGLAAAWSRLLAIRLLLVPIGVGVGIGIGIDSDCVLRLVLTHGAASSTLLSFDSDSDSDTDPDYPYSDRDAFILYCISVQTPLVAAQHWAVHEPPNKTNGTIETRGGRKARRAYEICLTIKSEKDDSVLRDIEESRPTQSARYRQLRQQTVSMMNRMQIKAKPYANSRRRR